MSTELKIDNIRLSDNSSDFADILGQIIKDHGQEYADAIMKKPINEIIEEFRKKCPEFFI